MQRVSGALGVFARERGLNKAGKYITDGCLSRRHGSRSGYIRVCLWCDPWRRILANTDFASVRLFRAGPKY